MKLTPYKLGDFCRMKYGKMAPKDMLADEGFPVFSGYRITGYAKEYLFDDPRVIVVARGVGGTGDVKMSPEKSWITNLSIVLDHDTRIVDKEFLLYRLGLEPLKDKLNTGAAQAQITIDSLKPYVLPLPELPAQQRIVSILSAYDDLIENNRRRIQLLEQAARLLYKEWFVHLRFPGYEHQDLAEGTPAGWTEARLGAVVNLKRGYDLPAANRQPGSIPVVSSSGITGCHSTAKAQSPGVVTGRYGTLGVVYFIQEDYWPLNTALYVQDFKGNDSLFVFHLLSHILRQTSGDKAAVPGVNRNDLHRIQILRPPNRLQDLFAQTVSPLYRQIRVLEQQISKLAEARDLLLPRLMNGEVAV